DDLFIAGYVNDPSEADQLGSGKTLIYDHPIRQVCFSWDVFRLNPGEIEADFALLATNKKSQAIDDPHTCQYGDKIFLEEGVHIKAAVLNAEDGPIYFGKNVKISEGSIVRGPTALCEGSQLSMGAKVRGNVTVGPYSKIGGEVSNAVLQGYSNKSHDGYLGSSVVGEWCNLGAATNNSNLKNNYGKVKMWNFANRQFRDSGLQFCGLIMGDHTRCAINTTFNTGTTTGIMSNIFGAGFHRNFIPSFSWGGTGGFATYQFEKAVESAERAMIRREQRFSEEERGILRHIFETTATDRTWELK
ncbi:MAG: glucose-1-phosphate thymidylyltransferase, partial [Bacteroidota bacterium]